MRLFGISTLVGEPLLPLWATSVRHSGQLPSMLHPHDREGVAVIVPIAPVGVGHQYSPLYVPHGDGGGMGLGTAGNTHDSEKNSYEKIEGLAVPS